MIRSVRTLAVWLPLVFGLTGIALTIILVREYITLTDGGLAEGLFCGGTGDRGCSQVAAHESSRVLGLPLALWGLWFYIAMSGLAGASLVLESTRLKVAKIGFVLATAAVVFDVYLAWTMVFEIGAVCRNCVASYAINLLLVVAWGTGVRLPRLEPRPSAPRWWAPAIGVATVAALAAAGYASWTPLANIRRFAEEEAAAFLAQLDKPPVIAMNRFAGQPSRGPANAPVQIALMGDFQCMFCRALAAHLERLQERHNERVRVWFVNAPVNSRCHPLIRSEIHKDACWLAEAGECAAAQGKFWQFHKLLFVRIPHIQVTRQTVERRMIETGVDVGRMRACLESEFPRQAMSLDGNILRELALSSVPSLVINGHVERGGIYPDALNSIVQSLLTRYNHGSADSAVTFLDDHLR